MAGYITLYKFTSQGLVNIKDSPQRIKDAKAAAEKLGVKSIGVWVTIGEYDLVAIGDAPNEEAMALFALAIGSQGNVTSQTMRALSEDEFAAIVAKLP